MARARHTLRPSNGPNDVREREGQRQTGSEPTLLDGDDRLAGHTSEARYGSSWYRKWTMGRMISLNASSPYANARTRIRTWLRML